MLMINMVIRYSRILEKGLEDVFYCWARIKTDQSNIQERFINCRPSDFWRISGDETRYTEFISYYIKPSGFITVSLRSKDVFRNGLFELRTVLPRWERGPMIWFGFENEDLFGGGCIHFMWDSANSLLKAFAGGFISRAEMDLTKFISEKVSQEYHFYRIFFTEDFAIWYINDRLRAFAIFADGDNRDSKILYDDHPYVVSLVRDRPSAKLGVLLDIDAGDISKTYIWDKIHPWSLRVSETYEKPMIYIDLYQSNSDLKIVGQEIMKRIYSAPFPGVFDYIKISFKTSGEGVLTVEEYDDEWSEYDKIKIRSNVKNNIYIDKKRSLLYRVLYEPYDTGVIKEAHVIMK